MAGSDLKAGSGQSGLPLLTMGFRPFFLAAGLFAVFAVPAYLALLDGVIAASFSPVSWHSHEMLFGYTAAVFCGFLLTAVPNWTGAPPVRGWRLLIVASLWLAGRVVMWLSAELPAFLVAVIDLMLLPALAALVAPALVSARNRRNYVFFALMALLTLANALMHAGNAGWLSVEWARRGQFLALDIVLLMIALIGGRIIPAFTGNWLRQQRIAGEIAARPRLDRVSFLAMAAIALADLAAGDRSLAVAVACLLAASVAAVRLAGWRGGRTLNEPILLVLHVGYAWLMVGLALRGIDILAAGFSGAAALHALTIGAIGTMTIAVMSRATLGHSGRPLRANSLLLASYVGVSVAALVRLAGGLWSGIDYGSVLLASGVAWTLAFVAFLAALGPAFFGRRRDGMPG